MPTASSLAWKTSLRKVRTLWHCSRLRSGALPMIDRGDIRQAIDRCSNIWASLPGAGYGQFEHKADSLIAKFKEAGGTVREIDVWAESPRLSPLWLSASSSACHGLVNHYRDNAITYKAQRDNRELKLVERGNYWHADASAWCCCARCKIHEVLADAKAENDVAWWCCRWSSAEVVHQSSSSVSVKPPPPPAWIMQPPPDWQTLV